VRRSAGSATRPSARGRARQASLGELLEVIGRARGFASVIVMAHPGVGAGFSQGNGRLAGPSPRSSP
jgi:hypothetical protein